MGKIAQVSVKYIVNANIMTDGLIDKKDVIGAIFGQTEGLLGRDLELRDLQKAGRIGRIDVNMDVKDGKGIGEIIIPSSLDKGETAIVAASLETIQRIGPCNAKIKVKAIEDVRISKRKYLIERAKELLKEVIDKVMPDSQELIEEIEMSVRVSEITEYGPERLPAGPQVDSSDEVIIVEGRADVLNLLKNGFKNCIAMNGSSIPETILKLCKEHTTTAFLDGDRGADLELRDLMSRTELDFVARAPDGKEVEELTSKEIHKAIRARIPVAELGHSEKNGHTVHEEQHSENREYSRQRVQKTHSKERTAPVEDKKPITAPRKIEIDPEFKKMFSELIGSRGALLLDETNQALGKVPVIELKNTLTQMDGVHAVILDGEADSDLIAIAGDKNIQFIIAKECSFTGRKPKGLYIITARDMQ